MHWSAQRCCAKRNALGRESRDVSLRRFHFIEYYMYYYIRLELPSGGAQPPGETAGKQTGDAQSRSESGVDLPSNVVVAIAEVSVAIPGSYAGRVRRRKMS